MVYILNHYICKYPQLYPNPMQAPSVLTGPHSQPFLGPAPFQPFFQPTVFATPCSTWGSKQDDEPKFEKFFRGRSWKPWAECLDPQTLWLPRTLEAFSDIVADPHIDYALPPRVSMSSGDVLEHIKAVIDRVVIRLKPATFKIGFTHDPAFRWNNRTFGYIREVDKWTGMMVVWAGSNATVGAYVEAAMILHYKGNLFEANHNSFGTNVSFKLGWGGFNPYTPKNL